VLLSSLLWKCPRCATISLSSTRTYGRQQTQDLLQSTGRVNLEDAFVAAIDRGRTGALMDAFIILPRGNEEVGR
jgi:hypothetical protein